MYIHITTVMQPNYSKKLIEKACKTGDVGLHYPREITQPQLCHVHEQNPKLHDHIASQRDHA